MTEFTAIMRGLSFRPITAKAIVQRLEGGETLFIQREPGNAFDTNAVMVNDPESGEHLGYVAKEVAVELAPLMDEGRHFSCVVESHMMKQLILLIKEIDSAEEAFESDVRIEKSE